MFFSLLNKNAAALCVDKTPDYKVATDTPGVQLQLITCVHSPVCLPVCIVLSGREGHVIHLVHLKVVVKDLTDLLDVRDVTRLKLRPHRDV